MQLVGVRANVTGTASVHLTWDVPTPEMLLGDTRLYYVILENGAEETQDPILALTNSPLLNRGQTNVVEV